MQVDSKEPSLPIEEYMYEENRFRALKKMHPDRAQMFLKQMQKEIKRRYKVYKHLAGLDYSEFAE